MKLLHSRVEPFPVLYEGDCIEVMRSFTNHSIPLIVCDLPYGILNKSKAKWDCPISLEDLWEQYKRILTCDGAIVLFGQGMFTANLLTSNPKWWRYNLVWKKGERTSGFLNCNRQPLRNHEDIIVFAPRQTLYNPQMEKCEPHQKNHSRGKQLNKGTNRCYGDFQDLPTRDSDEKYPKSVLNFNQDFPPIHPTQKPVALLEWIIRTYSKEGDIVLDNCMGSGSTGVACNNTHRLFVGIENDHEWFEKSKERLRAKESNCHRL